MRFPWVQFKVDDSTVLHTDRECSPWICVCGSLSEQIARTEAQAPHA